MPLYESTTSSIACAKAARTPPRSSAARPRAVVPPGEATARRSVERVVLAGAQELGRAGHGLGDERRRRAPRACRGARPRRPAPRRAAPSTRGRRRDVAPATRISGSGHVDDGAEAREQLAHLRAQLLVARLVRRREREHAAADLHRRVRLDAEHRRLRDRRRAARPASCGRGSRRPPSPRPRSPAPPRPAARACGRARPGRRARRARGWSATASPPTSAASACARPEPRVRAQHGLPPPERERAGHVAGADETELHRARTG